MIKLTHVPLLTTDQARDLAFWQKLGWEKKDDNMIMDTKLRWLTIHSRQQPSIEIIIQPYELVQDGQSIEDSKQQVGNQPGFCFSSTNIEEDYNKVKVAGAMVREEPIKQPWGMQFLFNDLCGNTHVVVEPSY